VYQAICQGKYDVVTVYHKARHGKPREEVEELGIPLETIEEWTAQLEQAEGGA
jgi:hypothetical protein